MPDMAIAVFYGGCDHTLDLGIEIGGIRAALGREILQAIQLHQSDGRAQICHAEVEDAPPGRLYKCYRMIW